MADVYIDVLQRALRDDPAACVAGAEQAYRAEVETVVASALRHPACRVILLAGPSSSGKTTTANILSHRLQEEGHPAAVVSLDNFYRRTEEPSYPRLPDGQPDHESVEALHIEEIRQCMAAVLRGEACDLPRYDFKTKQRVERAFHLEVPRGGYVIMEGLHALNPCLTQGLPEGELLRLFVSVSTNLVERETGARLLSGRKLRFLRRLSRDALYRASGAAQTYALWRSVLEGEDRYLYPYRGTADHAIDTFHAYEVGVLRPYAERLLEAPDAPHNAYLDAVRQALGAFTPLPEQWVPQDSLLREFIPGGIYEDLY